MCRSTTYGRLVSIYLYHCQSLSHVHAFDFQSSQEVLHFAQELLKYIAEDYEIACEHAHSCMIVIAHKKFRIDGAWHTWIDYDKFHALVAAGRPFTSVRI